MTDDNRFEGQEAHMMLWPALVTPVEDRDRAGMPTGKKTYSANFVMSPDSKDFIALRKMVVDTVKANFPAKYELAVKVAGEKPTYASVLDAIIANGIISTPFKSGTVAADKRVALGKSDSEYTRGMYLFKGRKPELKRDGSPLPPPAIGGMEGPHAVDYVTVEQRARAASKFFMGAEAFFEVSVAAYTAGDGGVTAYLNQVFLNGRGTRREVGSSPSERFGRHVGHMSNVDPTTQVAELS